jgi:hypothetical protein
VYAHAISDQFTEAADIFAHAMCPFRGMRELQFQAAAANRLEGLDCQGWWFVPSRSDATGGSALDRPVLEGYTIGSG